MRVYQTIMYFLRNWIIRIKSKTKVDQDGDYLFMLAELVYFYFQTREGVEYATTEFKPHDR